MTYLATALSAYYKRTNSSIRFSNGDSLNKLAIKMSEEVGFGFDPAALSRVLSGKRLFTPKQVDVFCTSVGLSESDRKKLQHALAEDVLVRYKFDEPLLNRKNTYTRLLEYVLYYERENAEIIDGKNTSHDDLIAHVVDTIRAALKSHAPELLSPHQTSISVVIGAQGKN